MLLHKGTGLTLIFKPHNLSICILNFTQFNLPLPAKQHKHANSSMDWIGKHAGEP